MIHCQGYCRKPMDIRLLPSIVPPAEINGTARMIENELAFRIARLKEKIEAGLFDNEDILTGALHSNKSILQAPAEDVLTGDSPKTSCSFRFYGQLEASDVSQELMKELEDEINKPTGITTIKPPPLVMNGVLVSVECGMVLEITHAIGLKYEYPIVSSFPLLINT